MPVPILPTKLYIPPQRSDLVPRPRLLDRLDEGLQQGRRLSLISAPAGFGKTTLATTWLYSTNRPIASRAAAWVTLDEGDNDPARLIAHVIAALQQVDGTIGRASPGLGLLGTLQGPPLEALIAGLIRDLVSADTASVLVLDDYHLIQTPEIHRAVDFLVDHQPPTMHLVVTSRDEPPLTLPRLRVRGQVTEITAQDLRFTKEEVTQFLRRTQTLSLSDDAIEALTARTEGWIAGLRLLTLTMQDDQDTLRHGDAGISPPKGRAIPAFEEPSGGSRYVAEYLVAEVLARQPEAVQAFLKATSALDHLTASLCNAVTGRTDSDELLKTLDEANLFIIALDDRKQWFRYHRMFGEVLHGMLSTQEDIDLHQRAMRWYEDEGMPDRAVPHALAAAARTGMTADAERLILSTAEEMTTRGEVLTVRRWLDALPDTRVRANGELCIYRGWILAMTGDLPEAGDYAQAAEEFFLASGAGTPHASPHLRHSLGKLRALRSFIVLFNDQAYDRATHYAEDALDLLPQGATQWVVLALWAKAEALERLNRAAEAIETLREAQRVSRTMHEGLLGIIAEGGLVKLLNDRGRRLEAVAMCVDALRHYADAGGAPLPLAGFIYSQLGVLSYEANELVDARAHHGEALALGERLGLEYEMIYARALAAPTWYALGETDRALAALRDGYRHASEKGYADADWFLAWEANIHLWQGDFVFARSWAARVHLSPQDSPRLLRIEQHVTYGRVLISQRRLADARHWLTRLADFTREHDLVRWQISAWLLQAIVADRLGDRRSALDLIGGAIQLAGPQAYVRAFLQEGPRVLSLLPELRTIDPGFVDRILHDAASVIKQQDDPLTVASLRLTDPLTDRELEVLHLIAAGYSNRDIAEHLVIAVGTVKRHINNVYSKLQVGRRTEAVARAREMGLV